MDSKLAPLNDISNLKVADTSVSKSPLSSAASDTADLHQRFNELAAKSIDDQLEFFLKSFIFALGDKWKNVVKLSTTFKDYLIEKLEKNDLDCVQAAEFLQHQGRTRTATQRRNELKDVDLNNDDRICFIEYLLLHYKVIILEQYFLRHDIKPTVSLANDGVGLLGVGEMLLEELLTHHAIDGDLERLIAIFMRKKKIRDAKAKSLKEKSKLGGVRGLTAKTELRELENEDMTDMNRIELSLAAAQRRKAKGLPPLPLPKLSGDLEEDLSSAAAAAELQKRVEEQEAQEKRKLQQSRNKLKQRAAMFNN